MKHKIIAIASALILLLCGCSVIGTDTDSLMRPPRATGDAEGIQAAIESIMDKEITYKYPKSGDYRSAIIRHDMDGDGFNETLAFYRGSGDGGGTHLLVLDKEQGDWIIRNDTAGPGGDIDKVIFGDLTGDGTDEIIIGWTVYNSNIKIVSVYAYTGRIFYEIGPQEQLTPDDPGYFTITYTEMITDDLNSNGKQELILIDAASANTESAQAKILQIYVNAEKEMMIKSVATVPLDSTVISYLQVKAGYISGTGVMHSSLSTSQNTADEKTDEPDNAVRGIVIDGMRDSNTIITEIICWDPFTSSFCAPLLDSETSIVLENSRSLNILSQDINNDSIIEIPETEILAGTDTSNETRLYLTRWGVYDSASSEKIQTVLSAVNNYEDNYYIVFPDDWLYNVTATIDKKNHAMYFYKYDRKSFTRGAELFRIQVSSDSSSSQNIAKKGFILLGSKEGKNYYVLIHKNDMSINYETVSTVFRLL